MLLSGLEDSARPTAHPGTSKHFDLYSHTAAALPRLKSSALVRGMFVGLAVLITAPVSTLTILPRRVLALLLLASAGTIGPALAAHFAGRSHSLAPALCLSLASAVVIGAVVALAAYLALVYRIEDAFDAWPWATEQQRRLATCAPGALACPFTGAKGARISQLGAFLNTRIHEERHKAAAHSWAKLRDATGWLLPQSAHWTTLSPQSICTTQLKLSPVRRWVWSVQAALLAGCL